MNSMNSLYPNFLYEVFNFDFEYDFNQTCNVVLIKNMTLIAIDRGWESIPESLLINLIVGVILLIPFGVVKYFTIARNLIGPNSWLQFIYGNDRDNHKKSYNTNRLHMIEVYFKDVQNGLANLLCLLPFHAGKCKANLPLSKNRSYGTEQSLVNSPSVSCRTEPSLVNSPSVSYGTEQSLVNSPSVTYGNEYLVDVSDKVAIRQPSVKQTTPKSVGDFKETTFSESVGSSYSTLDIRQDNFISFLTNLFVSDNDILKHKGHDAYHYLLFQRYIIGFLCVVSFFSIVVLLPVNIQGNDDGKAFARTTLGNVPNDSKLFWIPAILSSVIIIVGVFLMSRFANELKTDDNLTYCKTLLLRRLPIDENVHKKILTFFEEKFPDVKITGIQLILGYRKLEVLQQQFVSSINASKYCHECNQIHPDSRITLRPYTCGRFGCCCCCCCSRKDAEEYYNENKAIKENDIHVELKHIAESTVGSVFVTFETEKMATSVYKSFKSSQKRFCNIRKLIFNRVNNIDDCYVSYAPYPDDINWRDIAVDANWLWLRKFFIYVFLFIIFFFLTTPSLLLKVFEYVSNAESIKKGIGKFSSSYSDFLSPFLLMLMSIILPSIVTFACNWIPYKTISDHNHTIMSIVFAFYLLMIVILPSAGSSSVNALLESFLLPNSDKKKFRWHCLFPVDNGAFFVIYTLQAAILGNLLELLRIPELTLYFVYNLILPSIAEYEQARQWVLFEFPFGVSYARFMLIFTMTITFTQACPLIAPCGLIYMLGKHIVDRYNIYYVYTPTKINGRIHSTAILFVHISLIMMQFQLFAFLITKTAYSHVTMYSLIVLLLTLLGFTFYCYYHWFLNINHITNSITSKSRAAKKDICICSFTPPVFYELLDADFFKTNPQIETV